MDIKKLKDIDWDELAENFQGLDPEDIGSWPILVRIVIFISVFMAILFGGYYYSVKGLQEDLVRHESKEIQLLDEFENKALKAANLEQLRLQLAEMEESFKALLEQLPSDTEVPGLLEDISHTGLGSGLEFDTIDLGDEAAKEFYIELPINLKVVGDYHGMGSFVSGVAALPRIVTLHDYSISSSKEHSLLEMSITAKTYRYNDQNEGG